MPAKKKIQDELLHARHLGFHRSRCQAKFRGEPWELTEEDWNAIWTPERWLRRGRGNTELCMSLLDEMGGWTVDNVCLVSRGLQLKIKNLKQWNMPYEHLYSQAEWIA
jgi:hypothetical protein